MRPIDEEPRLSAVPATEDPRLTAFSGDRHADKEVRLRRAHELAISCLFEDDLRNSAHWFMTCAAICIRREGQDTIVAEVIEAMQRFMQDSSRSDLARDRAALRAVADHYDTISIENETTP